MPNYTNKAKWGYRILTGAMAIGFGVGAILSGLDRNGALAASQAVVSAGAAWELYGIAKYGKTDGAGLLASALGCYPTVSFAVDIMDEYRATMGVTGSMISAGMLASRLFMRNSDRQK
ncbi:MAG: hypothetical protein HY365_03280 [Candidatus Aenigmarchaeota archaeon]|nr:hypothetical protein [Candidatus Aenigmarchaeota archaeon]